MKFSLRKTHTLNYGSCESRNAFGRLPASVHILSGCAKCEIQHIGGMLQSFGWSGPGNSNQYVGDLNRPREVVVEGNCGSNHRFEAPQSVADVDLKNASSLSRGYLNHMDVRDSARVAQRRKIHGPVYVGRRPATNPSIGKSRYLIDRKIAKGRDSRQAGHGDY